MRNNELLLYRNLRHGDILGDIADIDSRLKRTTSEEEIAFLREDYFDVAGRLIDLAGSHGYKGNLWHGYLTYLLVDNENPYSVACEIRGNVEGSINEIALHDLEIFRELFGFDMIAMGERLNVGQMEVLLDYVPVNEESRAFSKRIRDRICELAVVLSKAGSAGEFKQMITDFYRDFGVGRYGLHKAFRIEHSEHDEVIIRPISNIAHVYLEDLIGYELPKQKLIENTEAFIEGRPANNCLLFGDAGTGKSSAVKGILNKYYDRGLRIIEIYKHQFKDLNEIISRIKNRNYRFIIYMDDLSFEDFEIEYKYLKAVIEGGLEKKPSNVLIYATSNRRHLIRENYSDKEETRQDMHSSDTVQEKLSLVSRFGVLIYFGAPGKKEFDGIVLALAQRYGIDADEEELLLEANKWELSHGGRSGRTASQFIDHLRGTMAL